MDNFIEMRADQLYDVDGGLFTLAARLVALDNGDHYTDELFHGITSKRMYQGRMQIILRSDQEAGNVTVKISSAGLKGTLRLKTIKE